MPPQKSPEERIADALENIVQELNRANWLKIQELAVKYRTVEFHEERPAWAR